MTTGFGVDRSTDGLTGTSAYDIRRINGALYKPGIVRGMDITPSTTNMNYTVAPGVVAIATGGAIDEIVLAPVDQTTVTGPAAPTTGNPRVDVLYVQQQMPSTDAGKASVVLGVAAGVAPPARSVVLATYSVAVGNTKASQNVRTDYPTYALSYGGSLGQIYYYQMQQSIQLPTTLTRYGVGEINLPTDRLVRWEISGVLSGPNGTNAFGTSSTYSEYGFIPGYEGNDWTLWSTGGLHQAWQTIQFSNTISMAAGKHTVGFYIMRLSGPGVGQSHYGVDGNGFNRRGIEFRLIDEGTAA